MMIIHFIFYGKYTIKKNLSYFGGSSSIASSGIAFSNSVSSFSCTAR